jgi:hypothetical protein
MRALACDFWIFRMRTSARPAGLVSPSPLYPAYIRMEEAS